MKTLSCSRHGHFRELYFVNRKKSVPGCRVEISFPFQYLAIYRLAAFGKFLNAIVLSLLIFCNFSFTILHMCIFVYVERVNLKCR